MARTNAPETTGIVARVLHDHAEAKRLLGRFTEIPQEQRAEAFRLIVKTLVAHETAEELVVYPALRRAAAGGAAVARDRLTEQQQATRMLADLERYGTDEPSFEASFRTLRDDVLEHADAEEQSVLTVLAAVLGERELARLGERYEAAKAGAPTHAHPLAPRTSPANRVAVPPGALLDRIRDLVRLRDAPRLRAAITERDPGALFRRPPGQFRG